MMPPMVRLLRSVVLLVLLVFAASSAGCGSSDSDARGDVIEYELFSSTRQLGEEDLAAIVRSDEDGTIVFSAETPALEGIAIGQVLLGGSSPKTPAGLLRVVGDVARTDEGIVLRTVAAPLQVAFRKLHVRLHRSVDAADAQEEIITDSAPLVLRPQLSLGKGTTKGEHTYEVILFDGDGDPTTTNDQVKVDAKFGGGFSYELSIDVNWGAIFDLPGAVERCLESFTKILSGEVPSCTVAELLPEVKMTFDVTPFVDLDVNAVGAATLEFEREFQIATIPLAPLVLGPLVFTPSVDILATIEGGASARFEAGAYAHAKLDTSLAVSSKNPGAPKFETPELKDLDVGLRPPKVDLHAKAKASIGARLNLSLYDMVGPNATARAVARIEADPSKDPCFILNFGFELLFGVRITSPDLLGIGHITFADWQSKPLRLFDKDVARGSCETPPEPPHAPGSGPTSKTFQAPPFEPWAKSLGGRVDGTSAATFSFLGAPDLVPTIDGRWIAAGPFARALHKIDDLGASTWTSKLALADHRLSSLASVPTGDAGIMALLRAEHTFAFALAKTGQSGALAWARGYEAPSDCVPEPTSLVRDEGPGFLVFGWCRATEKGFFARVNANGDLVRARTFEDGDARVLPAAATRVEGDTVLTGRLRGASGSEQVFVTRLDAEDRPKSSLAFGCPERVAIEPTAIVPSEGGGVTVVGSANGPGFVARVRKDGTLGFARFPNLGIGASDEFIVTSVAELPATGLVIGAATRDVLESQHGSVVLAGLDGGGSTRWARRYAPSGGARSLAWPAVRLTDDGGALVTALAGSSDDQGGELFAMKVHAKDGFLGEGTALSSAPVNLRDLSCQTSTRPFAPQTNDFAMKAAPISLRRE